MYDSAEVSSNIVNTEKTKKVIALDSDSDSDDNIPPPPPPPEQQESKFNKLTTENTTTLHSSKTPSISPPNINNEEKDNKTNDVEKQKQLDLLKQTYVDVAKKKINRQKNIYNPVIDTEKIVLSVNQIDKTLKEKIKKKMEEKLELKCNKHGLIKKNSIIIINISPSNIKGSNAEFLVTYQAMACNPVEGMIIDVNVVNITKAGIRGEFVSNDESPIIVYISRDHNNNSSYFNKISENQVISVKIIGVRYELNDKYVSTIGELNRI